MSSAVHLSAVDNLMSNGFNHLQVKEKHIFPLHQCHQMSEEVAGKDAMEIRALYLRLMAMISKTLGKDYDYVNIIVKKHTQVMNTNYNPAYTNQDLTFGVTPHLDMCGVIVFIQGDVSSLQVLKD
ncbi:hypothetical protein KI387_027934, partial [Taxus chinensis]